MCYNLIGSTNHMWQDDMALNGHFNKKWIEGVTILATYSFRG